MQLIRHVLLGVRRCRADRRVDVADKLFRGLHLSGTCRKQARGEGDKGVLTDTKWQ